MLIARNRTGQLAMVINCRSDPDANGLIVTIVRPTLTQLDLFCDVSMQWEIEFIHARPLSLPLGWTKIYCPDHLLMPIRPQDEGDEVCESALSEDAMHSDRCADLRRDLGNPLTTGRYLKSEVK